MRTVVLGKIIENNYEVITCLKEYVDQKGYKFFVYDSQPRIKKSVKIKEWKELCSFKGEPRYNSEHDYYSLKLAYASGETTRLNISENESVYVYEEIFRADLNELHLHTDKIIGEIDINKENAEKILNSHIKSFNKMMITSNEQMKTYCNLHKLSYEDTDCFELFKIVFPNEEYEIIDGVMKVKSVKYTVSSKANIGYVDDSYLGVSCSTITDKYNSLDDRITSIESNLANSYDEVKG